MHVSWVLPAALALHVAEEAPGFAAWARRHAWAGYRDRDFMTINATGLALTVATTAAVRRSRSDMVFLLFHAGLVSQQALWNPVFHLATTLRWRERSPGVVTALALFPPVWWHITRDGLRTGALTPRRLAASALAGGALHAVAVAQQVFGVGRRRRAGHQTVANSSCVASA
jgi:hypothetical protein